MKNDFRAWLQKPFREAGSNRRAGRLIPEDTLQEQIDLYADINECLEELLSRKEGAPNYDSQKEILMLYDTVRERAAQGETLLAMISDALKSGKDLPHPAKTLQDFAKSIQEDIAMDHRFGDELWRDFDLYKPQP